jgi:hypothetical protein
MKEGVLKEKENFWIRHRNFLYVAWIALFWSQLSEITSVIVLELHT